MPEDVWRGGPTPVDASVESQVFIRESQLGVPFVLLAEGLARVEMGERKSVSRSGFVVERAVRDSVSCVRR